MRISNPAAHRGFSRFRANHWNRARMLERIAVMTSWTRRIGLGLTVIAAAQVSASAVQPTAPKLAPPPRPAARDAVTAPAPIWLRERINQLGQSFDGRACL